MGPIKISTEYKVGWGMWEWGACVLCGSIRRCTRGKCKSWDDFGVSRLGGFGGSGLYADVVLGLWGFDLFCVG